jgi:hypothetical protein
MQETTNDHRERPFGSGAKIVSIPSFVAREIVSGQRGFLQEPVEKGPSLGGAPPARHWSDGSDDEVVKPAKKSRASVDLSEGTECPFTGNAFDGIFTYLLEQTSGVLGDLGLIQIKGNSLDRANEQDLYRIVDARWTKCWRSRNEPRSFIEFDFLLRGFCLTHYTLRTYLSPSGGPHLRSWKLAGRFPSGPWFDIDVRNKVEDLGGRTEFRTYQCQKAALAQIFRLTQTGLNSNGDNYLVIATIEFFGKVK